MKPEEEILLDKFGKLMDEFIQENRIQMLIEMPEGTNDPEIKDNVRMGPVVQFYILLAGLVQVFREMVYYLRRGGGFDWEPFIDTCLEMVKAEITEGMKNEEGGNQCPG